MLGVSPFVPWNTYLGPAPLRRTAPRMNRPGEGGFGVPCSGLQCAPEPRGAGQVRLVDDGRGVGFHGRN